MRLLYSDNPNEEDILNAEEKNTLLLSQLESYKYRLIMERNARQQAETEMLDMRRAMNLLKDDFTAQQKRTQMITDDMNRQYQAMESELTEEIEKLNYVIRDCKAELENQKNRTARLETEKDNELAIKDSQIAEMKNAMDQMALEFGGMLKQTLEKMSEKIVISDGFQPTGANEEPQIYASPIALADPQKG
jgi:hypothetical protein